MTCLLRLQVSHFFDSRRLVCQKTTSPALPVARQLPWVSPGCCPSTWPGAAGFRAEVHASFCLTVVAWIVCLGRPTISRVWETTGHTGQRNHAAAYRLFSEAVWNWDEVCRLLLLHVLALAPGVRLWVVIDDTLAHKRGAKVAFGGIFLDAVLSTKKHKVFRFGNNWVVLGVVVELPFRPNRYSCLSILWRTKNQLAAEMPPRT
jgi:hypothetical protein